MRKQISRISIHQSSKLLALMFFVATAIVAIPFSIVSYLMTGNTETLIFLVVPFVYLIFGYIMYAIIFWVYNLVAASFGGLEFEFTDVE